MFGLCVNAYSLNFAKLKVNVEPVNTIPFRAVVITPSMQKELINMKPDGNSVAYQGGYFDALYDVRVLLNIAPPKFKLAPKNIEIDTTLKYILPYDNSGFWRLNITKKEKVQFINSNTQLCKCQNNITEVRIWKN
jgi:hypothetical protein